MGREERGGEGGEGNGGGEGRKEITYPLCWYGNKWEEDEVER